MMMHATDAARAVRAPPARTNTTAIDGPVLETHARLLLQLYSCLMEVPIVGGTLEVEALGRHPVVRIDGEVEGLQRRQRRRRPKDGRLLGVARLPVVNFNHKKLVRTNSN